jgi:hypothetical protein
MQTRATNKQKDDDRSVTVNNFQGKSFDIGQTIESKDLADVLDEKDWRSLMTLVEEEEKY